MIDTTELTTEQQELVAKHYNDALRIGNSYKSSVLHDDDKENIAVRSLISAARKFDPSRGVLFTTLLYRFILNALGTESKWVKDKNTNKYHPMRRRLPKNKLLYEYMLDEDGYSRFAALFPYYDNFNNLEYLDLLASIRARLDDRQKFLFDALLDPIGTGVPVNNSTTNLKVTIQSLADISGVSKQRVSKEIIKLRLLVERMMKCQDSQFFHIAPKETKNG